MPWYTLTSKHDLAIEGFSQFLATVACFILMIIVEGSGLKREALNSPWLILFRCSDDSPWLKQNLTTLLQHESVEYSSSTVIFKTILALHNYVGEMGSQPNS